MLPIVSRTGKNFREKLLKFRTAARGLMIGNAGFSTNDARCSFTPERSPSDLMSHDDRKIRREKDEQCAAGFIIVSRNEGEKSSSRLHQVRNVFVMIAITVYYTVGDARASFESPRHGNCHLCR